MDGDDRAKGAVGGDKVGRVKEVEALGEQFQAEGGSFEAVMGGSPAIDAVGW